MLSPLAASIYGAIGLAGATGLGVGGFAYASHWPTSQIFGRTLIAPRHPDQIALTFDDGPNPAWTPRLLDILAEHQVHATFFMVGKFVKTELELARRVAEGGHLIGNHTWNHPDLSRTRSADILDELTRTNDILGGIIGKPVRYFRPPFGARRPYVLKLARQLGLIPVTWNAMTTDWSEPSADTIAQNLIKKIDSNQRRGWASNIVLHDGNHRALNADRGPSVSAASQLLDRYTRTHKFLTLDAWI
ncbi:polysaccharide deacetylase family protein [Telmatobacter sp. DSM 110680]|uniref:Polysaccharide deacetylase family protein n=1 Tax=Telmatobacter sp. DSM 110680 TaxID=3036704 RepID=A0AAU7DMT5_9BACT